MPDPEQRPDVSVVLPYYGDAAGGRAAASMLLGLNTQPGDELILADNTPDQIVPRDAGVRVVDAGAVQSPYSARNKGVAEARNDWLLFIDADCHPVPDLLDRYLAAEPAESDGAVVGPVEGLAGQPGLVPRYIRSRGFLNQTLNLKHPYKPLAVTANLLVRRAAFDSVGGFAEGTRSGADSDFSWRLQDAGWKLNWAPAAIVEHEHRDTLRALLRQVARDGAGLRWLEEHHPGSSPTPPLLRPLLRAAVGMIVWSLTGQFERGLFKGIDGLVAVAEAAGYRVGNRYD